MRWKRVVAGAVLGGLLGFGGQFVADFFCWDTPDDRKTPYRIFFDGTLDGYLPHYGRTLERQSQARQIFYQVYILYWLVRRGEIASRTTLIVAFLCVSAALALEQQKKQSASKISDRLSDRQTALNEVPEPEHEPSRVAPDNQLVQIETAEQADVLNTAPKKERAECP